MNMALVMTSLPVMLRTTPGWMSLLLFLGLLIPHQGTTIVHLKERQLPGDHQFFQGLAETWVNSSG